MDMHEPGTVGWQKPLPGGWGGEGGVAVCSALDTPTARRGGRVCNPRAMGLQDCAGRGSCPRLCSESVAESPLATGSVCRGGGWRQQAELHNTPCPWHQLEMTLGEGEGRDTRSWVLPQACPLTVGLQAPCLSFPT